MSAEIPAWRSPCRCTPEQAHLKCHLHGDPEWLTAQAEYVAEAREGEADEQRFVRSINGAFAMYRIEVGS